MKNFSIIWWPDWGAFTEEDEKKELTFTDQVSRKTQNRFVFQSFPEWQQKQVVHMDLERFKITELREITNMMWSQLWQSEKETPSSSKTPFRHWHVKNKQARNQADRNLDSNTGSCIAIASFSCSCHQVWQDWDETPAEEWSPPCWELHLLLGTGGVEGCSGLHMAPSWEDITTSSVKSGAVNGAQK